jgi:hypothetical protein
MNIYQKFAANVFVAKCTEKHEKGETIFLETKYGKEHECIVFNLVGTKDGFYYYSIVRADGYNVQERARKKAERLQSWASNAEKRSNAFYEASNEGRDFLALGEPIKVGHHSEKRHRALIDRNWDRMGKSVAESRKAEEYNRRAEYWENKVNEVNLSMPESIEYYQYKLEKAQERHKYFLDNPEKREHSFSLTYAKKDVNEAEKNLKTALLLWQ